MSRTISDIYTAYKIMPSLQLHMLRVGAVASLICDSINVPVNRDLIIQASLLHDMGNLVKSNLEVFKEFCEPEGVEYWKKVKKELVTKYGANDHEATMKIIHELGVAKEVPELVDQYRFSKLCTHKDLDDFNIKIAHYSDGRVGPHGIMSYEDRMDEAGLRYKGQDDDIERLRLQLVGCGLEIEKQIFSKCKIKPEDITDEAVAPIIENLRHFVIK